MCLFWPSSLYWADLAIPASASSAQAAELLPAALSYSQFGYDASADVVITSNGYKAIGLFVGGILMMLFANLQVTKEVNAH